MYNEIETMNSQIGNIEGKERQPNIYLLNQNTKKKVCQTCPKKALKKSLKGINLNIN